MARIFVTGMAGTGKSAALAELARRGYRVVDTDDPGWREYRPYAEPVDELHRGEFLWIEADLAEVQPLLRRECTHELDASRPLADVVADLIGIASASEGRAGLVDKDGARRRRHRR